VTALARSVLAPASIALVGVSRDATRISGLALPYLRNAGFEGDVFLLNPSADAIPGVHVVPDVHGLPDGIDLAFSSVSAQRTPQVVAGLAERGAGVVVVGASGFSELGDAGAALEADVLDAVSGSSTRLIGPNCNGLYAVQSGVALGFNRSHGRRYKPGGIAIVSQSGALIGAVADLCTSSGAGLRGFFSTGNELDVRLVELLEVLAADAHTEVIALVLDRVGDAARFRAACELAARNGKRVLAFKFGNTAAGRKASESHSARMSGDSATYDVLFAAAGVTRCASLTELAITAALLESRPAPTRHGALVISTSGAGGALAADAMEQQGVGLVELADDVKAELATTLRFVKPDNPVDVGAGGSANAVANFAALRSTADGACTVFIYLPPPTPDFAELYSRGFTDLVGNERRSQTIGVAVMIDRTDTGLVDAWLAAGIPVVSSVAEAAAIVSHLQPRTPADDAAAEPATVDSRVLSEVDAARIAAAAGIPFPVSFPAADAHGAGEAALRIGGPVVVKGVPAGVAHKSAAGLVALGLADAPAAADAAEGILARLAGLGAAGTDGSGAPLLVAEHVADGIDLILSAKRDPEFGTAALLGLGGTNAEVLHAFRVLLPPYSAERLLAALDGLGVAAQLDLRGEDRSALAATLADALTDLADALATEGLSSLEINPLRVLAGSRIVALDALAIAEGATS
jgi:acyl-CoA synthetase (NDP forming)